MIRVADLEWRLREAYVLFSLPMDTVASYMVFRAWHLLLNGHSVFTRQLQGSSAGNNVVRLVFFYCA